MAVEPVEPVMAVNRFSEKTGQRAYGTTGQRAYWHTGKPNNVQFGISNYDKSSYY
jgi:hypothetical protein